MNELNRETHGYEYISISWGGSSKSGKTQRYVVTANRTGDVLGRISWFGRWRQYVFFPEPATVFNVGCMADISSFIKDLRPSSDSAGITTEAS